MALTYGTKLGPYEIQSPLGKGGMGEVYRGKDTRLDRPVAIKLLPTHLSSDPESRQRLEREAKAISALQHANICTLYDVGTQDGTEFLVMEYLEGQTLAERLQKGPVPVDQLLKIATEIAQALEKAHQHGIVHRDLKPANVMLTKAGAKLMDFGLAKSAVFTGAMSAAAGPATPSTPTLSIASLSEPAEPLTQKGSVLGTLQYMAPEVLQGNEADARSDIFSFGCVLYEMVTGKRAFPGKSQLSVVGAILEREPERMTALQPLTPLALEHIVHICLAKNAADRWQNAGDLARSFQLVRTVLPTRVAKRPSSVRLVYGIAVAYTLVTTLVLLWALRWRTSETIHATSLSRFSFGTATNTRFTDVAVSPDGRQIAFADNSAIWVRSLDSQVPRKLPGTSAERLMFWSPDGNSIAFLTGFKLRRISLADSVLQDICEIRGFSPAGGTWSKDDIILIGSFRGALMKVNASGGEPVPLKLQQGENGQRWPSFLPDGRHFLYLSASGNFVPSGTNRAIRYTDLDGNGRVVLRENSNAEYAMGSLLYVKDGALVGAPFDAAFGETRGAPVLLEKNVHFRAGFGRGYFDAAPGVLSYTVAQPEFLASVDRKGRGYTQIGREGELTSFDVAPDSKSAVIEIANERSGNGELWLLDLERQVTTRLTTDDASWNWGPIWSADGKAVYFSSTRSGISDLYEHAMATNEEQQLLSGTKRLAPLDVSRDGKYLLYEDLDPSSAADLWILPLSGDRKPFPYIKTNYMETSARFSPNGRWVVYVSNESGNYEIYVQSFPTLGQAIRISTEGGLDPRWRRDGRELYFISLDGRLMTADVKTDGNFSASLPKPLFRFSGSTETTRRSYWPAPDGQRFLVMKTIDDSAPQIQVTVNWTEALKK